MMTNKMTMPAGRYWIGDPCNIFPQEGPMADKWAELFTGASFFKTPYYEMDDGKIKVWAAPTVFGGGLYVGSTGKKFSVVTGLLGIIPLETLLHLNGVETEFDYSGMFVEFEQPFEVESLAGSFSFGDIRVDSNNYRKDGRYDGNDGPYYVDYHDYHDDRYSDDYDFDPEYRM